MTLYAGDRAPKIYQLDLVAETGLDFTDVTAWSMLVERPDGTEAEWTVDAVTGLTSTAASIAHILATDGSDLPKAGPYYVRAILTLPTGRLQSDPVHEHVRDDYGLRA